MRTVLAAARAETPTEDGAVERPAPGQVGQSECDVRNVAVAIAVPGTSQSVSVLIGASSGSRRGYSSDEAVAQIGSKGGIGRERGRSGDAARRADRLVVQSPLLPS